MKKDIRFLLTNNCNYNCYFCHNEGASHVIEDSEMCIEDYTLLFSIYSEIEDWKGVTLSGGEPLLYTDILPLVKSLHEKGAIITLVTNGFLIEKNIKLFKYIDRVNISIHTLEEPIYNKIVGRENVLSTVLSGLDLLRKTYPKLKIRLNITPTKGINWSSKLINDLIDFSKKINSSLKFTELFPKSNKNCVHLNEIEKEIRNRGYIEFESENRYRYFKKQNHSILITQCTCSKAIEFSEPIQYCRDTHDLYINHNGKSLLCRLGNETVDFLEDLKSKNYESIINKIKISRQRIDSNLCFSRLKKFYNN